MSIFKKKDPNTRELSLSNNDIAELSFYTRRMKEIEIDLYLWRDAVNKIKNSITSRLSINPNEVVNWDHAFIDQNVTVIKMKPQPAEKVVKKEEVKKDAK
jgi:hypothetical protein